MRKRATALRRILPALLAAALLAAGCGARYDFGDSAGSSAAYGATTGGGYNGPVAEYAYDDFDYEYAYDMAGADIAPESPNMGGGEVQIGRTSTAAFEIPAAERKIVYTVDLSLETKDFDEGVALIETLCDEFGGLVQSSNIRGTGINDANSARWSDHSLRIPAERLDEFVARLEETFHCTYNSRYSDDITDSYYDVQARINSLEIAYEQLQTMLEQAEELEYLIEVQRELTRVRAELESYLSARSRMDGQVSMSTVNVSLQEVLDYQPLTPITISFSERVSRAFQSSWRGFVQFCQNATLFLIEALPFLILLAVAAVVAVLLLRRRKKRRRAAKEAAAEASLPEPVDAVSEEPQETPPEDDSEH